MRAASSPLRRPAMDRRGFLKSSALAVGGLAAEPLRRRPVWAQGAPAVVTPDRMRPGMPYGVQSGDVTGERAIVWSRTDRPARFMVEWATNDALWDARRVVGPAALAERDFTARVDLTGLPAGQQIFYRAVFQDLANPKVASEPTTGRFRTPPAARRTVTFAFSGDEAGQGWGINPEWGGMKMYEVMRRTDPDFFIHSGDQIYADGPIQAEVRLADGTVWKNVTTLAKSKVAETLEEFRGNFAYNFLDQHKRRFCAQVPLLVQWDDHETRNNWYPGQMLGDERYQVRSASLLAAYAKRAMLEYNPFSLDPLDPERIYRAFAYGPSLDVFMIDERSYRGPNTPNRQSVLNEESAFLGAEQRRDVRSQRDRPDVRAGRQVRLGAGRHEAEPSPDGRHAVLRPCEDRRRDRGDDGHAARRRGEDAVPRRSAARVAPLSQRRGPLPGSPPFPGPFTQDLPRRHRPVTPPPDTLLDESLAWGDAVDSGP